MIQVVFPEPNFKLKEEGGKHYIFCLIRKQWLVVSEEEWVRQNFVHYLISVLNYPAALVALEKELVLNGLKKRFDILIYNKNFEPWMLVECKAPEVSLNEEVFKQALRYNMVVPVSYIILTNGNITFGWQKGKSDLHQITEMPVLE